MDKEKDRGQVLVLAAMEKESVAIRHNLAMAQLRADVFDTGIGKVNAAIWTTAMLFGRVADDKRTVQIPDCVLSVGCSGALDASLKPGDVVVGTDTAYWDVDCGVGCWPGQIQGMPPCFPCDLCLRDMIFDELKRDWFRPKWGAMLTGDQFIMDDLTASRLRKTFPVGTTIDMETAAVAQTCWRFAVPFAAVRVISDTPDSGEHRSRAEEYHEFWKDGGTASRFAFVRAAVRGAQAFARYLCDHRANVAEVEKGLTQCLAGV